MEIINWIDKNRFIVVVIVMLIIWSSLFTLFWFKGEALMKDPCSICAERVGESVTCYAGFGTQLNYVEYLPNGTIDNHG